jgi:RimJ/RimL family protein N-acetyltransferase
MYLGAAFLRENFLKAFETPIKTENTVLKVPHADDAAAIAQFFNADDYDIRRRWKWGTDEDFTEGYVLSSLLDFLDEGNANRDIFMLNIYSSDRSEQFGFLQFYGMGKKPVTGIKFYLLPSHHHSDLAGEVVQAVMDRTSPAGLMVRAQPFIPGILQSAFASAAGGAVVTPRLSIRPYIRSDHDQLLKLHSGRRSGEHGYHEQKIMETELGNLNAGVFRQSDGELVGEIHFWQDTHGRPRMGYHIAPLYQGQGLASEAHKACIEWSDGVLPVPVTRAEFLSDNHASEAVLRKSGFHRTGEMASEVPGFEDKPMVCVARTLAPR